MVKETIWHRVCRIPYAIAYSFNPSRILYVPKFLAAAVANWLRGGVEIPEQDRVVALHMLFGGLARKVTPLSVLEAARRGFFLESHAGPQKWWTLEDRMAVVPGAVKINKRLRSQIRNSGFKFTLDRDFSQVLAQCAAPRPGRPQITWIRPGIAEIYNQLHKLGYAHSFEIWDSGGALAGGGYGLAIGKVFVLESMFHRARHSSKIGLVALNYHLNELGFALNDSKAYGFLYDRLGYQMIPRARYQTALRQFAGPERDNPGRWQFTSDLNDVSNWDNTDEKHKPVADQKVLRVVGQQENLIVPPHHAPGLQC